MQHTNATDEQILEKLASGTSWDEIQFFFKCSRMHISRVKKRNEEKLISMIASRLENDRALPPVSPDIEILKKLLLFHKKSNKYATQIQICIDYFS